MTEELEFEHAVSRVFLRADAGSPPEVTREEVRCMLSALKFPAYSQACCAPPRALTSPSAWDEDQAVFEVVDLKCRRALVLISSSSAGQSHSMGDVYAHLLLERSRLQPFEAA